jgi:hypothetical protein
MCSVFLSEEEVSEAKNVSGCGKLSSQQWLPSSGRFCGTSSTTILPNILANMATSATLTHSTKHRATIKKWLSLSPRGIATQPNAPLVIPQAVRANVEVKLKLKDLGSRSHAIYGKIKASATEYRNKSVHLFSCERGRSLSFPSGSTSILPLSPSAVAVPGYWQRKLHIEVDLIVIICDSQEEQDKNLKFSLEFSREILNQEREVDGDQLEVNIKWYPIF